MKELSASSDLDGQISDTKKQLHVSSNKPENESIITPTEIEFSVHAEIKRPVRS